MYGYIYKTTNKVNNKIYVGKKCSGVFLGNDYMGSGTLITRAIKKYGKDQFSVVLLEECMSEEHLCEQEKYWIKELDAQNSNIGYNLADGGQGGAARRGHPMSEETKQKMHETARNRSPEKQQEISEMCRQRQLGKNLSAETREKIRLSMLGKNSRPHTAEENEKNRLGHLGKMTGEENPAKRADVRKKISEKKMGHEVTQKTRDKISKAQIGKRLSEETKRKQSAAAKGKTSNTLGRICINNGSVNKMIFPHEFSTYELSGWIKGKLKLSEGKRDLLTDLGIIEKGE